MTIPDTHAIDRPWVFPETIHQTSHPAMWDAWNFSTRQLHLMRAALAAQPLPACVSIVAVAGSLGRMEGSALSDADVMILVDDSVEPTSAEAFAAYAAVWQSLATLGIEAPRADGIYATPVAKRVILDPGTISKIDEDFQPYGTRFQFLLEAQPIFGTEPYAELTKSIVGRFAKDFVAVAPEKEWTYLLNELVRYFRSLCLTYQWVGVEENHPQWRLRNIKSRHSRLLLYAGLLFLLGESSREKKNKIDWLIPRLKLTPLERIAHVYAAHDDRNFDRIATAVDVFLNAMRDPQTRRTLNETDQETGLIEREANSLFQSLKQNSDALLSELLRFVLERRDTWSERFWQYLIF